MSFIIPSDSFIYSHPKEFKTFIDTLNSKLQELELNQRKNKLQQPLINYFKKLNIDSKDYSIKLKNEGYFAEQYWSEYRSNIDDEITPRKFEISLMYKSEEVAYFFYKQEFECEESDNKVYFNSVDEYSEFHNSSHFKDEVVKNLFKEYTIDIDDEEYIKEELINSKN